MTVLVRYISSLPIDHDDRKQTHPKHYLDFTVVDLSAKQSKTKQTERTWQADTAVHRKNVEVCVSQFPVSLETIVLSSNITSVHLPPSVSLPLQCKECRYCIYCKKFEIPGKSLVSSNRACASLPRDDTSR